MSSRDVVIKLRPEDAAARMVRRLTESVDTDSFPHIFSEDDRLVRDGSGLIARQIVAAWWANTLKKINIDTDFFLKEADTVIGTERMPSLSALEAQFTIAAKRCGVEANRARAIHISKDPSIGEYVSALR
jgi:hypothetical protein